MNCRGFPSRHPMGSGIKGEGFRSLAGGRHSRNLPPSLGGSGIVFEVIDIFPLRPRLPTGMTTANKITILRILLIPFFVVEVLYYVKNGNEAHRLAAILSFAVAAICDGIDGYIARRYNQRSELGAILDPLADKLLLVSGIVVLSFEHRPHLQTIPLWLTGTIIGRDILVLAGMLVIQMTVGKVKVRPRLIGKVATVLQMVIILWVLLKWNSNWLRVWLLAAAICTGISGLLYVWDGSRQLSAHPASSPKTET
jgi:CDP-diacylglycerol--glycerol-3-phosphate 3-phosphatidyltransferase